MKTIKAGRSDIVTLPDPKDPGDRLLYRMDWTYFLTPLGDAIDTSTWDAGDLTVSGDGIEGGAMATYLWLEGGTVGRSHTVSNTITTGAGRTVVRSFKLRVEER
jgi:hypothetical protein